MFMLPNWSTNFWKYKDLVIWHFQGYSNKVILEENNISEKGEISPKQQKISLDESWDDMTYVFLAKALLMVKDNKLSSSFPFFDEILNDD